MRLRLLRVLHVLHTRKTCQFLLFVKFYLHVTTASREGQWNLSKSAHAMRLTETQWHEGSQEEAHLGDHGHGWPGMFLPGQEQRSPCSWLFQ